VSQKWSALTGPAACRVLSPLVSSRVLALQTCGAKSRCISRVRGQVGFQADLGTWAIFKAVNKCSTQDGITLCRLCRVLCAVCGGVFSGSASTTLPATIKQLGGHPFRLDVVLTSGMKTRLCRSPLRLCAVLACLLLGGAGARTIRSGETQQTAVLRRRILAGTAPAFLCC